jgi:hypothetical protein
MAMQKAYDAAVKGREYTDSQGNKKAVWIPVGSVMRGDDGNLFMLLDRHFNPAGIPNPDNRGNVLVSFFEPKERDQGPSRNDTPRNPPPARRNDMDDEIPF